MFQDFLLRATRAAQVVGNGCSLLMGNRSFPNDIYSVGDDQQLYIRNGFGIPRTGIETKPVSISVFFCISY